MKPLPEIRANIAQALADLDEHLAPPLPQTPSVVVGLGDNLGSLIANGVAGTTYWVPPEWVSPVEVLTISKPCAIVSTAPGAGRASLTEPMPTVHGEVNGLAPDIAVSGLRVNGISSSRTLWAMTGARQRLHRVVLNGSPQGQKRGVYTLGEDGLIAASHIGNCWYASDSQAVCIERAGHRLLIDDSFLEASGENLLLGGGTLGSAANIPTGVRLRNSHLFKPLAWKGAAGIATKTHLELKAALDFRAEGCLFENNWVDAQSGYAIVFTVRNQYNADPFVTIQDAEVVNSLVKNTAAGISILGRDDITDSTGVVYPSVRMARVAFRNLAIENLDNDLYGGNGRTVHIQGGPKDLTFDGVRVIAQPSGVHSAFAFGQPQHLTEGLIVRNSDLHEGSYGIWGDGMAVGNGGAVLTAYAPGSIWEAMTIRRGGVRTITYPAGTTLQ